MAKAATNPVIIPVQVDGGQRAVEDVSRYHSEVKDRGVWATHPKTLGSVGSHWPGLETRLQGSRTDCAGYCIGCGRHGYGHHAER